MLNDVDMCDEAVPTKFCLCTYCNKKWTCHVLYWNCWQFSEALSPKSGPTNKFLIM